MARVVLVLTALLFSSASFAAEPSPAKTTLAIKGMTCGGCVAAVKVQLKKTPGVTAYEVSLDKGEAIVTYDPARTDPKKIAESVSKSGFEATVKGEKKGETSSDAAGVRRMDTYASCGSGPTVVPESDAADQRGPATHREEGVMPMESCCAVEDGGQRAPAHCPRCGKAGRVVERITVKALLRPEALARLSAPECRFCGTPDCPVVYFGHEEAFDRDDLLVAVFQKEPRGARTVCYCFAITEGDLRRELLDTGRSSAFERITALVKADRCACEVKNPQGSCCLGNVSETTKELEGAYEEERRVSHHV